MKEEARKKGSTWFRRALRQEVPRSAGVHEMETYAGTKRERTGTGKGQGRERDRDGQRDRGGQRDRDGQREGTGTGKGKGLKQASRGGE